MRTIQDRIQAITISQDKKATTNEQKGDAEEQYDILKSVMHEKNQKETNFCNRDVSARSVRYLFMTILSILSILVIGMDPDVHLSVVLGVSIWLMYVGYFGTLAYFFISGSKESKGRYLFRIYTRTDKVCVEQKNNSNQMMKWAKLNIAIHQECHPLECIHSISEFSAIDGGLPGFMLSSLGQYTWASVTVHYMIEIHFMNKFEWHSDDFVQIIGVSGLVMLGIFEADPFNKWVNNWHQIGAILGFGTIAGYYLQQRNQNGGLNNDNLFDIPNFSYILGVIFVIFYSLWMLTLNYTKKREQQKFNKKTYNQKRRLFFSIFSKPEKYNEELESKEITKEMKREITKLSLLNVIFEGIVLFCGSTALSLWLMDYSNHCGIHCYGYEVSKQQWSIP